MSQIGFFAANEDLLPVIRSVEKKGLLKYARTGNSLSDHVDTFDSGEQLPCLGHATAASSTSCAAFLVCRRDTQINLRVLNPIGRAPRFLIDQLINPDSVTLTPAGVWNGDIVLGGCVGSASDSEASRDLMNQFRSAIRHAFTKLNSYYVGPAALEMLKQGARLTMSVQSPRDFDLVLGSNE